MIILMVVMSIMLMSMMMICDCEVNGTRTLRESDISHDISFRIYNRLEKKLTI